MSAPLIWVGLPLILAVVLWFLQKRERLVFWLGAGFSLVLALTAWLVPIGSVIPLGPIRLEILTTFGLLGRQFILDGGDRTFLILMYGFGTFWFFGARAANTKPSFIPFGMAILGFLVAAVAVKPFLYAALLIEVAVLLSVPLLLPTGTRVGQGVMRFVIFQTLALPFILLAGWASSGVEANPTNRQLLIQAVLLLGLGFAFWLAAFPFYSWVPLLQREAHPYAAGFLLSLLPTIVLVLGLNFLNGFTWLREYEQLKPALLVMGIIMVVTGGLWAAFQKDIRRLFGYSVIVESGFSLLALGIGGGSGLNIFASLFLPRLLALAVWSLALSTIRESPMDEPGLLQRHPFAVAAILAACFSLAGFPLLAGFPVRQALFESLARVSINQAIWVFVGNAGLLLGCFRTLAVLIKPAPGEWKMAERWPEALLLGVGVVLIVLMGLFPAWFLPRMQGLLQAFERLL